MPSDEEIKRLVNWLADQPEILHAQRGGSTVICNPPPTDTDIDINVLCTDYTLFLAEWERCGDDKYAQDENFAVFRKVPFNVLCFKNRAEFEAVLWCTSFAQKLNMTNKEHRYELFERVRELARNQF